VSVDAAHPPSSPFAELGLSAALVKALARTGISTPTPVQAVVIPDALAGRDVLGRAATGSGKTLAFGLPILTRLAGSASSPKSPRALIVVPTRELAAQVRGSLEPMADAVGLRVATVYGGTPYDRQIKRLRAGVDVVVATPGRLQDLISRGACRLDRVEITVLDEADHLCDLGFFPAVSEIVATTPAGGQRMLLSATLDGDVDKLVRRHLRAPVRHDCDPGGDIPDMEHHVLVTGLHNKLESTAALLRANPRSIVFTRTRHGATDLAHDLTTLGITTVDLHGSLTQKMRERNLRKFRSGQADVVVATDVAARGIHVDDVGLVVHYDVPTERKAYLHRSGRTGRAGRSGAVVTLTTAKHVASVTRLQRAVGVTAIHHDVRTAPQPMTAESLARNGFVPSEQAALVTVPPRQTDKGSHRVGSRAASRSGRARRTDAHPGRDSRPTSDARAISDARASRDDRSHSGGRPTRASRDDPSRSAGGPDRAQPSSDAGRSSRSAAAGSRRPGESTRKAGGPPPSGKAKKARWTAAQRRAGSKR